MKLLFALTITILIGACSKTPTVDPVQQKTFTSQGESILVEAEKK